MTGSSRRFEVAVQDDPRAPHEVEQTKMALAGSVRSRRSQDRYARDLFHREAAKMLRRVIALAAAQAARAAWAWFDLAKVLEWLASPRMRSLAVRFPRLSSVLGG